MDKDALLPREATLTREAESGRDSRYLSAGEAAAQLGISRATLYAYVSRGLIRSEAGQPGRRERQYHLEDIEHLRSRRQLRREPDKAVAESLHYGAPVLESSITLIRDGKLYYRGHEATRLAREETFERVAALLWTGDPDAELGLSSGAGGVSADAGGAPAVAARWVPLLAELEPVERCQVVLPLTGRNDLRALDLRPSAVAATGARILSTLAATLAGSVPLPARQGGAAATLARAWSPQHGPDAVQLLQAALILCADHELNVSAFTARCVASAGATPYEVVSAGLAALKGVKHGGVIGRVEAFLREAQDAYASGGGASPTAAVRRVVVDRLRRGDEIPGFGHPMYPSGDPRASLLLDLLRSSAPAATQVGQQDVRFAAALTDVARELLDAEPTIDLGLWLLGRVLGLPAGGGMAVFALGRSAGWLGQAIEQYQMDRLIRPRARYTGPLPS